jgi:protein-disulfide isomerase
VYQSAPKKTLVQKTVNASLVRPVGDSDHIFGSPAAPVMIIEYCDFDSEYCKAFHETLRQIVANQGTSGKVAWVYREFPLTEIHPDSITLSRAAECAAIGAGDDSAANNDAFWRFANVLFDNQPVSPSALSTAASTANLSGTASATCYAHTPQALIDHINSDRQNALDMGATGVPFSVIVTNGKPPFVVDGMYSYDVIKLFVDQALQKNR